MSELAIEIRGLTKRYQSTAVVDAFDLSVADGEFVSLLGPSGCGKTTTLRCVAGLEEPDQGTIRIGERLVSDRSSRVFVPPHKRGVGMVFQSYALWPHMTVFGNVAYPLRARRRPRAEVSGRVLEALRLVGLADLGPRAASDLSGGQQQRVALARALVAEPRVLLLDEPLSNLDASLRTQLRQEIRRVHRKTGMTSLYVTHDQLEAGTLSDRILVLNGGRVEQAGTPKEIFSAPVNRWVASFVGFENFLAGRVTGVDGDLLTVLPDGWEARLQCRAGGGFGTGDRVELAVRATSFAAAESDAANAFPVTIRDVTYLGDTIEYDLAVPGGALSVRMAEREAAGFGRAGDACHLCLAPEQVVPLPPADSRAPVASGEPAVAHVS